MVSQLLILPNFLDTLTLSQPREADYAHQIILAPPDFQTFRRPWSVQWGPHAFSPAVTKAFKKVTRYFINMVFIFQFVLLESSNLLRNYEIQFFVST